MVARFVRDEEVVGSNPATPTVVIAGQGSFSSHGMRPLIVFAGARLAWTSSS